MSTAIPSQKVAAGALAGAITTIVIYAVKAGIGTDTPGGVAAAVLRQTSIPTPNFGNVYYGDLKHWLSHKLARSLVTYVT
jgi:hypothetical protein